MNNQQVLSFAVLLLSLIGLQKPSPSVVTLVLQADLQDFLCRCCHSQQSHDHLIFIGHGGNKALLAAMRSHITTGNNKTIVLQNTMDESEEASAGDSQLRGMSCLFLGHDDTESTPSGA